MQEMQEAWVQSLDWEDPLEEEMQPTPVFLSEFHFLCNMLFVVNSLILYLNLLWLTNNYYRTNNYNIIII